MNTNSPLDQLNRLRRAAGAKPLKRWAASQESLNIKIQEYKDNGYEDPGPDPITEETPVAPPVDFGPDAKADTPPTADEIPALKDSALSKNVGNPVVEENKDKIHKHPARLARGTDTETHCRKAVADAREKTKKEKKADKERKKSIDKDFKRSDKGKKPKKAKIKKNKDGTATKTTTSGNVRQLGKELAEKITKQRKEKHADKRADPDNFTVAELGRECGMDPKVARAKLRRHEDKIKKLHTKGQDRWVFPNSARKQLKAILCPEKS